MRGEGASVVFAYGPAPTLLRHLVFCSRVANEVFVLVFVIVHETDSAWNAHAADVSRIDEAELAASAARAADR